jgi:hypothetical protein
MLEKERIMLYVVAFQVVRVPKVSSGWFPRTAL